jgi:hypothetical protein
MINPNNYKQLAETLEEILSTQEQFEKSRAEQEVSELEDYYWANEAKNNEDDEGLDRYLEENCSKSTKDYFDRLEAQSNIDEKILAEEYEI